MPQMHRLTVTVSAGATVILQDMDAPKTKLAFDKLKKL